jgi:hypothetical protein
LFFYRKMFLRSEGTDSSSIPLYILAIGCLVLLWFFFHTQHVIIVQTPRWRPMDSYKVTVEVIPHTLNTPTPLDLPPAANMETKKDV